MSESHSSLYGFSARLLDGRDIALRAFEGKVLLVVNTASRCGFTPQYQGLQDLYRTFHGRGFQVLGFPCNQFGRQEPGSEQEIQTFCQTKYGVTFPMFAKIDVNGQDAHPLYRFLKKQNPGVFGFLDGGRIKWNFTKFLIDRDGIVKERFGPSTAIHRGRTRL
ncbi:MAG: glutathione peroxidase [Terracidiphilus sp.]